MEGPGPWQSVKIVSKPHFLEQVVRVVQRRAVTADRYIDPERLHSCNWRNAISKAQVGPRVVNHGGSVVGGPAHVVVVETRRMGDPRSRTQQIELLQRGHVVERTGFEPEFSLQGGFEHVYVDADIEFPGRIGHPGQESGRAPLGPGEKTKALVPW